MSKNTIVTIIDVIGAIGVGITTVVFVMCLITSTWQFTSQGSLFNTLNWVSMIGSGIATVELVNKVYRRIKK